MSVFERGTTIRFRLIVKDFDGNIVTPTETPTCKVFGSDDQIDPLATLAVESYGIGQYQTHWKIPNNLEASVLTTTICNKCGNTVIASKGKTYYGEWSWGWNGLSFVKRVPFTVVVVELSS